MPAFDILAALTLGVCCVLAPTYSLDLSLEIKKASSINDAFKSFTKAEVCVCARARVRVRVCARVRAFARVRVCVCVC